MGCAMNVRDSEHMIAELTQKEGYTLTASPKEADLILINTCSVREKPERKLFSEIGGFNKIKKEGAKIGVCGCTASAMGASILRKSKGVSFVLGARNVSKITEVIHQEGAVEVDTSYDDSGYLYPSYATYPHKAMINISIGCDKSCAYCIVPYTRGEEISIPLEIILNEAKNVVSRGAKEIMLLGQNVNNYGRRFSDGTKGIDFTYLLQRMSEVDGLERIRFASPHPLHMDDAFIDEFAKNPKIAKSIHMPLQSGSTKILKAMRRGYSKEWFLDRVERIKGKCDCAFSTDIIVGFPGEEEEDFADSIDVLRKVGFEQLYSFVYSPRPFTEAYGMTNIVDAEVAKKRLAILQAEHNALLEETNKRYKDKTLRVLIDAIHGDTAEGRSGENKIIAFKNTHNLSIGDMCDVKVTGINRVNLSGAML